MCFSTLSDSLVCCSGPAWRIWRDFTAGFPLVLSYFWQHIFRLSIHHASLCLTVVATMSRAGRDQGQLQMLAGITVSLQPAVTLPWQEKHRQAN